MEICLADGRVALHGLGWVASVTGQETQLELEWSDGDEEGLVDWLFGEREARGPTVLLDDLESPDEVELPEAEGQAGPLLRADSGLVLTQELLGTEPIEVPANSDWELAKEYPTEPLGLEQLVPSGEEAVTPIALTDVVEQVQADLDALAAPDLRAPEPPSLRLDEVETGRHEPEEDDPWGDRSAATQIEVESASERGPDPLDLVIQEPVEPAEPVLAPPPPPLAVPSSKPEVTPLARIGLVRRPSAEAGARRSPGLPDAEPGPFPALGQLPLPTQKMGPILAIDSGTSMTRVAVAETPVRLVAADPSGATAMPSVVVLEPSGETLAGAPALDALGSRPSWGVVSAKRLLGRSYWSPTVERIRAQLPWTPVPGPGGQVAVKVEGREHALEEVMAVLLRRAFRGAALHLGAEVNRAFLTCPSWFGARQREAWVHAAELAGLHVEGLVSSCLAAVAAHVPDGSPERRRFLVFDLGAGTLDVALVEAHHHELTVRASGGHALLGGIDFDAAVAQLFVRSLEERGSAFPVSSSTVSSMLDTAEGGKQALGEISRVHLPVSAKLSSETDSVEIARGDVEAMWGKLVDKAVSMSRDICRRAGVAPMEIDEILLAGGQSTAPYVERRLREVFKKPCVAQDHRSAVALGAARLASSGSEMPTLEARDCLPYSLVLGLPGGTAAPLVPRDSILPASGRLDIELPPGAPPELLLFEGDHLRVEGCDPHSRVQLETVSPNRDTALSLRLEARIEASGRVQLDVIRRSTGTKVEHRIETVLTADSVARALASGPPSREEPAEPGFFEWLRNKLRSS